MKNVIQTSVSLVVGKLTKAMQRHWATRAESVHGPSAIAQVTSAVLRFVNTLSLSKMRHQNISTGTLTVSNNISDAANDASEELELATAEMRAVSPYAFHNSSLGLSASIGSMNKVGNARTILKAYDPSNNIHKLIMFRDPFDDNLMSNPKETIGVSISGGVMRLAQTEESLNATAGLIKSVKVFSNGESGNPRETKAPIATRHIVRDLNESQYTASTLVAPGVIQRGDDNAPGSIVIEEHHADYWDDHENISSDPGVIFNPDGTFEIGCIDMVDYTVPVHEITPFSKHDDIVSSPIGYGEALELADGNVTGTKNVSIFEYTSSKNAAGRWPRIGYGWNYAEPTFNAQGERDAVVMSSGTDLLWVGPPGNFHVTDIKEPRKMLVVAPVSNDGSFTRGDGALFATIDIQLTIPTSIKGFTMELDSISRPTAQYPLPNVTGIKFQLEDGSWFDQKSFAVTGGVVYTMLPGDNKYIGVMVDIEQPYSYETYVGHPFIAYDITFTVPSSQQIEHITHGGRGFSLPRSYVNENTKRFIVRLPTTPVLRGERSDVASDLMWILGPEASNTGLELPTQATSHDAYTKVWSQKVVVGTEIFPARRWAARINTISLAPPEYLSHGHYESKPINSLQPIRALWIDTRDVIQSNSRVDYYVYIPGLNRTLPITPRNAIYKGSKKEIPPAKYIFDPMIDLGPNSEYINLEDGVHEVYVIIDMTGSSNSTPVIDSYTLYLET